MAPQRTCKRASPPRLSRVRAPLSHQPSGGARRVRGTPRDPPLPQSERARAWGTPTPAKARLTPSEPTTSPRGSLGGGPGSALVGTTPPMHPGFLPHLQADRRALAGPGGGALKQEFRCLAWVSQEQRARGSLKPLSRAGSPVAPALPPAPSLFQRRFQKGQKEEAKVPGKLLHPLAPADTLNVDTG